MMDIVTGLVDGLDPATMLPDLEAILGKLAVLVRIVMLVGPAALLILGLIYLFLAPKEANHDLGFRCWWGMSSVEVWQFTQKLAGAVWAVMGVVFGVIAAVSSARYAEMPQDEMLFGALRNVMMQIFGVLASILLINIVLIVMFDHKGYRRFGEKAEEVAAAAQEFDVEMDDGTALEEELPIETPASAPEEKTLDLDDILAEVDEILGE